MPGFSMPINFFPLAVVALNHTPKLKEVGALIDVAVVTSWLTPLKFIEQGVASYVAVYSGDVSVGALFKVTVLLAPLKSTQDMQFAELTYTVMFEVAPIPGQKLPAGHVVQADAPAAEYVPAEHTT